MRGRAALISNRVLPLVKAPLPGPGDFPAQRVVEFAEFVLAIIRERIHVTLQLRFELSEARQAQAFIQLFDLADGIAFELLKSDFVEAAFRNQTPLLENRIRKDVITA